VGNQYPTNKGVLFSQSTRLIIRIKSILINRHTFFPDVAFNEETSNMMVDSFSDSSMALILTD
jgi:hypothetical protein